MQHISISGPVAAGKSTLLTALLSRLGDCARAHTERPQDNPFISEYYADSARWSFHSQMTFLALYFDDAACHSDEDCEFFLYDRCLIENLVIARYRLQNDDLTQTEYDVIEKMARGLERLMPPIDKYIYLCCSVDTLCQHMRQRARDYESALDRAYAAEQKALYDAWVAQLPADKVLLVDADQPIDVDAILRFLET